jgi:hypothetical protein
MVLVALRGALWGAIVVIVWSVRALEEMEHDDTERKATRAVGGHVG